MFAPSAPHPPPPSYFNLLNPLDPRSNLMLSVRPKRSLLQKGSDGQPPSGSQFLMTSVSFNVLKGGGF